MHARNRFAFLEVGVTLDYDEMNTILKILPTVVVIKKIEEGIAIAPINQPEFRKIVEMSPDVRDKVWNWIREPKVVENKAEWNEIREPIMEILIITTKIMLEYGSPENRKIFRSTLDIFLKQKEQRKI